MKKLADFALHALQWEQSAGRFYISILPLISHSVSLVSVECRSDSLYLLIGQCHFGSEPGWFSFVSCRVVAFHSHSLTYNIVSM